MLKTLRKLYKAYDKGESINEFDTNINSGGASEESMQMSARRLSEEREELAGQEKREVPKKQKKTYKQRVESMTKKTEMDNLDGIDTDYLSQFIKNFCFICGGDINDPTSDSQPGRYIRQGNSCDECNTRINSRMKNSSFKKKV